MIQILQKCLTELNCDQPRLDYIRGIIEAAMEMSNVPVKTVGPLPPQAAFTSSSATPDLPPMPHFAEIRKMAGEI